MRFSSSITFRIVVLLAALTVMSCSQRPDFRQQEFVLASNTSVTVHALELTITNKGCGRKWIAADNQPAFEQPWCELELHYRDSIRHISDGNGPWYIGAAKISIEKMNPWGSAQDSLPPGACRIRVERVFGAYR